MNSVFNEYDVFLVDLFGVLWDGVNWINGAKETLHELIKSGKTVIILSNAAFGSNEDVIKKYAQIGLNHGEHFNFFVSSGGVFQSMLKSCDKFIVKNCENCSYKYAVLGKHISSIFADTQWTQTDDFAKSEFIYASVPQLTDEDKEVLLKNLQETLYVSGMYKDQTIGWESDTVEPFLSKLREILPFNKTLIVANPDKVAFCPVRENPGSDVIVKKLLIRQGALGQAYEQLGGTTKFIGKPYLEVYKYALNLLKHHTSLSNKKILMIGDTLETDILGAINATNNLDQSIDSVMVLSGVTAHEMKFSHSDISQINCFFKKKNILPTHVMDDIKIDSKVLF